MQEETRGVGREPDGQRGTQRGLRVALSVEGTGKTGRLMDQEDTQPNTLPRPPPRPGWRRVVRKLGTTGLVTLGVSFLIGVALASVLFPPFRHGISHVVRHGAPNIKSSLVTPNLHAETSPLSPSSFTRGSVNRPSPAVVSTAPATRRVSVTPRSNPPTWTATPVITPTVQPVTPTPSAVTPTSSPTPTPTPTPTITSSSSSASPTVTTIGPPVSPS